MTIQAIETHRSDCPINLLTEVLGDKWSILILRDMMFYKRRYFNELLRDSEEGIASNILRDRLVMLEKEGMVVKVRGADETHKQKVRYSLTEKGIDVLPLMIEAIRWSLKYKPVDRQKYKPAVDLTTAEPETVEAFKQVLLKEHVLR